MFKQESLSERWNIAKRFQLCYRCLAEGHHGKSCQRTRQCGKNGCHKVHHRLLHLHQDTSRSAVFEAKSNIRPCSTDLQHEHQRSEAPSSAYVIFGMEGNNVRRTSPPGSTGVYLLDFFCSGIQFNLLLSPYPCFIFLLYLDLYVLGDDALIS